MNNNEAENDCYVISTSIINVFRQITFKMYTNYVKCEPFGKFTPECHCNDVWNTMMIIFQTLLSPIITHISYLLDDLDLVKDNRRLTRAAYGTNDEEVKPTTATITTTKRHRLNRQFLIPLLILNFLYYFGIFGTEPEAMGKWEIHMERVATHKVFPRGIWLQVDIDLAIVSITLYINFLSYLLTPRLEARYVYWVIERVW